MNEEDYIEHIKQIQKQMDNCSRQTHDAYLSVLVNTILAYNAAFKEPMYKIHVHTTNNNDRQMVLYLP